jgi:hypothetical protein
MIVSYRVFEWLYEMALDLSRGVSQLWLFLQTDINTFLGLEPDGWFAGFFDYLGIGNWSILELFTISGLIVFLTFKLIKLFLG